MSHTYTVLFIFQIDHAAAAFAAAAFAASTAAASTVAATTAAAATPGNILFKLLTGTGSARVPGPNPLITVMCPTSPPPQHQNLTTHHLKHQHTSSATLATLHKFHYTKRTPNTTSTINMPSTSTTSSTTTHTDPTVRQHTHPAIINSKRKHQTHCTTLQPTKKPRNSLDLSDNTYRQMTDDAVANIPKPSQT